MKMTSEVYQQIRQSPIGSDRPEQGGILFSDDGGTTITKFIYDSDGSRSGTTYTPQTAVINKYLKDNFRRGIYFAGIIHSHPYGYSSLSMGRRRVVDNYTISDEEAILKILSGLNGNIPRYFIVAQSSYKGGNFSMRCFKAFLRPSDNEMVIEEEPIQIVGSQNTAWSRDYVTEILKCKGDYTAVIVGSDNIVEFAKCLVKDGVCNFLIIDNSLYGAEDLKSEAKFSDIGISKADSAIGTIKAINPVAKVKIIKYKLDYDIDNAQIENWLTDMRAVPQNTIVCLCSTERVIVKRTRDMVDHFKLNEVACRRFDNNIETYIVRSGNTRSFKYQTICLNDTLSENIASMAIVEAKRAAINFILSDISTNNVETANKQFKAPKINKYDGLYSKDEISKKVVVVIGCGGSRSYIENLVRAGIEHFVLIDGDTYSASNLQTQMAYSDEKGKNKADVIAQHIRLINPYAEIVVKKRMLDEKVSDSKFASWVGNVIYERPEDVLIAACTDNFLAQARCSRLALKYGCPFIQAGIYPGGRVLEIIFFHPAISKACPRCMLRNRYKAHLEAEKKPAPAVSDGTSIFFTEELNAKKGFISLSLLLYHKKADARYSQFLDDNRWVTHNGKHAVDRNFMFYTLDNHLQQSTGIEAYRLFDKWGRKLGSKYQVGVCLFMKKKPYKGCPDCGGKGNLLSVKGKIKDTREGLYY